MPKLIGPSSLVTSDIGYIRFHGRNKVDWWTGDNASRYDYLYKESELEDWVSRVRTMIEKVRVLFISFNNHARGQAVENARNLKGLLVAAGIKEV